MGALSDLPSDDPKIFIEFTAIKDTVLEMSKVITWIHMISHRQYLLNPVVGKILRSFHNGPRQTPASDSFGICESGIPANYGNKFVLNV